MVIESMKWKPDRASQDGIVERVHVQRESDSFDRNDPGSPALSMFEEPEEMQTHFFIAR